MSDRNAVIAAGEWTFYRAALESSSFMRFGQDLWDQEQHRMVSYREAARSLAVGHFNKANA